MREDRKEIAKAIAVIGALGALAYVLTKPKPPEYIPPKERVEKALVFGVNDKSLTIGYPSVYVVEPFVSISSDFPFEHFPLYVKCVVSLNGDSRTLEGNFTSCGYWILGDASFSVYEAKDYTLKAEFYARTSKNVEVSDVKTYTKHIDIYKAETVNINIQSQPISVYCKGIYPEFEGNTPLMVKVEKGKTFGFTCPKKVNNYIFSGVDNAQMLSTNEYVTIKGLADKDKTVTLYYVIPTPSTPKYRWSSDVGEIKVYDVWIDTKTNTINIDIECVNYNGLNGAIFIGEYVYGSGWGVILDGVGLGRNLVTLEWGNYASLLICADLYAWHTYIPVIRISSGEIRRV